MNSEQTKAMAELRRAALKTTDGERDAHGVAPEMREIARLVGSLDGRYRCGALDLQGRFDVYERNGSLFFERWEYNELGAREGEIEYRLACAACGGKH